MKPPPPHQLLLFTWPVRRLLLFALAVIVLAQLAISAFAWQLAGTDLAPELQRKAQLAAASQSRILTRAVARGVPFERLEGVAESFDDMLSENQDIAYVLLKAVDGKVLYRSGAGTEVIEPERFLDSSAAIVHRYVEYGAVHVGVDRRFIASRMEQPHADLGVLALASLLIAFEILLLLVTLHCSAPLRQIVELMTRMAAGDFSRRAAAPAQPLAADLNRIEARINHAYRDVARLAADPGRRALAAPVLQRLRATYRFAEAGGARELALERSAIVRILTFLFMGAEMLSRPILPLYAGELAAPGLSLAGPMHAALPLSAFLLGVALSMPFAARWSEQAGARWSYLAGALASAAGLAFCALAPAYFALLLGRALTGAGYALMLTACQGQAADPGERSTDIKGMAMFVGAIMAAEACAPALGGLLAERFGYRSLFGAGACVALAAAALAALLLSTRACDPANAPSARLRLADLRRHHRFLTLSLLAGVPARFLYSAVLMLLVPLMLSELVHGGAAIGRHMMLYGLVGIVLAPLCAHLAARLDRAAPLIAVGGMLTGAGLLPLMHGATGELAMFAIVALGVGQSLSIPAWVAWDAVTQEAQIPALLRTVRLLEWLGAAAGPLVAGALIAAYGLPRTALVLAVCALAASLLFLYANWHISRRMGAYTP